MTSLPVRRARVILAVLALAVAATVLTRGAPVSLDRDAERWVDRTFNGLTLQAKIGQMLMPSAESGYVATDSDQFARISRLVREVGVGGVLLLGATEPVPGVLLNNTYGAVVLGQPHAAASLLNRLQQVAAVPLLNAADFEWGVGMRIASATSFPRAMAFGAVDDERLTQEAARIIGMEARALGVHVDFGPVADVNNNPRNPVINTRSFGQDPRRVGAHAAAYVRGLHQGGALATLKHFPGHGDTDVDSHLGLPLIASTRDRLDVTELPPFRSGLAAGADAVMIGHIVLPALEAATNTPATFSRSIVSGLLRKDLAHDGLVVTDSMSMDAVARLADPGAAAVQAVKAGHDIVLDTPDTPAAHAAIVGAVQRGEIDTAQIDASVRRILRLKASVGLHARKVVSLDSITDIVGTNTHAVVADEVSRRSITLLKDERQSVPLTLPASAPVLYLSLLDYPSGWRVAAPSRTFLPALRARWPNLTAVELSDRSTPNEIDLVRAMMPRFDGVVANVFVRTASGSGRTDLAPALGRLLQDAGRLTAARRVPFVTTFFGNPYAVMTLGELPTILLTYDFYDRAEGSALRALTGEAPVSGRLPIELPGLFSLGAGLVRSGPAMPAP